MMKYSEIKELYNLLKLQFEINNIECLTYSYFSDDFNDKKVTPIIVKTNNLMMNFLRNFIETHSGKKLNSCMKVNNTFADDLLAKSLFYMDLSMKERVENVLLIINTLKND